MNTESNRRSFLRVGALCASSCLAGTFCCQTLFAKETKEKGFSYKIEMPKGFPCNVCKNAVTEIMNDKKMRQEIEKRFPKDEEVIFYVGRHKGNTFVAKHAVAVGTCARDLTRNVDCYVKICKGREQGYDYKLVYKSIIQQMEKKP